MYGMYDVMNIALVALVNLVLCLDNCICYSDYYKGKKNGKVYNYGEMNK